MSANSPNIHGLLPRPIAFPAETANVVKSIQQLDPASQQKLFKVSDAKYAETAALYAHPTDHFTAHSGTLGLYAYTGEAFKFLSAPTLSQPAAKRAEDSLAILSGLFGVVQPGMAIPPYRLEMQSALPVQGDKNLYALWRPRITHWLNEKPVPFIIDAMSSEYRKAVDWKLIRKPVIHVDFQQLRGGKVSSISAFGKQARGTFARWVLEENVQSILSLAAFNLDGYSLAVHQDDKMIFLREER